MRDNSSLFLAQTSYTLDKNSPLEWNFRTIEWLGENSTNSSCHIWNHKSVFLLNFVSLFTLLWEINLLYFFSCNFIWFLQKEPATVQNFRLLTAQKKFHQIYTLIGYFSESIYSVSKKSVEELCVMIPKSNSVHSLPLCRGVESPTKFSKKGGGGGGGAWQDLNF